MKLICTSRVGLDGVRPPEGGTPNQPPEGGTPNGNRRGTAEIELLLVIPVLLAILFITGWELSLGKARMTNAYNVENEAYTQIVSGNGYTITGDPVPPVGINGIRPVLPNWYVAAKSAKDVTITGNEGPTVIHTQDRAIMLDTAWHYGSRTLAGEPTVRGWFESYVGESHPGDVVQALGLKPAWPP